MNEPDSNRAALDRATTFALLIIAEVQALLLFVAHEAAANDWGWFTSRAFLTVWYSVVILPPGMVSLMLRGARDRYAYFAGLAVALLVALLGWHTGGDCGVDPKTECGDVVGPYGASLAVALFIALPFLQGFRDHGVRIPYATLFHASWDNALTVGAAAVFTGAAWLILLLWSALFALVGIDFFKVLFQFRGFIYPVTGLLAGFGIVLARHQAGALQAVLRVCLSLGRGLLPLIGILALAFLGTLVFTGLQPLWDTKTATAMLLALVFGTVALVNGVLHDGSGVEGYRPALRGLLGAALLTLPVYAVIAAVALHLRVGQYGWTTDRLWAAMMVFFACAYAFGYGAAAVVRVEGRWLGLLPRANTIVALVVSGTLLLAQSPLLDFRNITVQSQLARLDDPTFAPTDFDFAYFRWELGQTGLDALEAAKQHPRVAASPEALAKIERVREAKNRWESIHGELADAGNFEVFPAGAVAPPGLLEVLARGYVSGDCKGQCALVKVEVMRGRGEQWLMLRPGDTQHFVFALRQDRWERAVTLGGKGPSTVKLIDALKRGELKARDALVVQELEIGGEKLTLERVELK